MEQDKDKSPGELLETIPVQELIPGFDKDADWALLSRRLHPRRRIVPVQLPLKIAAALLIMAGCWYLLRHKGTVPVVPAVSHAPMTPPQPAPIPVQPTVMPEPAAPVAASHPSKHHPRVNQPGRPVKTADTSAGSKPVVILQPDLATPQQIPAPPFVPAATATRRPPRKKALSIIDIANEDRPYIVQGAPPRKTPPSLIDHVFNMLSTDDRLAASQPYILRSIFSK